MTVASRAQDSDDDLGPEASAHLLHKAVWLADRSRVKELLHTAADINAMDNHGATPLMLAVELLPRACTYEDIIQQLLQCDADPRLRSQQGWSPLDEAVSRGDEKLTRMLFDGTQRHLGLRWEKRLGSISSSLRLLPDFECKIRWEFESPVLPLLNKIAPSDVVWLRKQGTMLRIDSTLASWKKFRLSKRRNLTTLFRGDVESEGAPGRTTSTLCMLNHAKQTVVDVTEGLGADEAGAVLGDLVSADAMQWDMQVDNLEVAKATSWLGTSAGLCEVNGWKSMRFDVRGTLGVSVRKKGQQGNCMTFQEYFGCSLPPDACLPELREEFRGGDTPVGLSREASKTSEWSAETSEYVGSLDLFDAGAAAEAVPEADTLSGTSEVLQHWPDTAATPLESDSRDCGGLRARPCVRPRRQLGREPDCRGGAAAAGHRARGSARAAGSRDSAGKATHRVSASVWLATDFAVPMQQFLPVLEALALEHEAVRRLRELLASQGLREAADQARTACEVASGGAGVGSAGVGAGYVFPVRASVPLNLALRAIVHFEAFELRPPGAFPAELFKVPVEYKWVPRCEAQKTPKRAKKRMLLANLAL